MESITGVIGAISDFVWGPFVLVSLLAVVGVFLTIRLRGIQFSQLGPALRYALIKRREQTDEGDVSHYKALMAALSGTVGTGNVAGVATAIALGGPGALFWMWIVALFGMATKYSEAILGVLYRDTDRAGEKAGGPMFYLSRGLGEWNGSLLGVDLSGIVRRLANPLGVLFAGFAAIAAFGIGNTVQSNATSSYVQEAFGVPLWITGLALMVLAGLVILGGIRWIGTFAGFFVPFMMVFYVALGLIIILLNITELPAAIGIIFYSAFTGPAAVGGATGGIVTAISLGVARGIFSNESGLGTGGIAAAAARTTQPVRQGVVSMTQTFIDTIIICSITGLAIVMTGVWRQSGLDDDLLTQAAFTETLGGLGSQLITIGLAFFTFSTLITWAYYGERNIVYLFGRGGVVPYRLLFIVVIFLGSILTLEFVWAFATLMNGLMAIPNLIGLLLLSGVIVRETRSFFARSGGKLDSEAEGGARVT